MLALGQRPGINVVGPVRVMVPTSNARVRWWFRSSLGAGIRVKIVEAMDRARNRLDHSWLGRTPTRPAGEHLLVADQPAESAQAAIHLLRKPSLRDQLAGDVNP